MRVLYVLCERTGGLTEAYLEEAERTRERLALLSGEKVAVVPYEQVGSFDADAVVLSGSQEPWVAHNGDALDRFVALLGAHHGPVLGICAGMQLLVRALGGTVGHGAAHVHGTELVEVLDDRCLLAGLGGDVAVFADHSDEVTVLGARMRTIARSATCAIEAIAVDGRPWWGTQFHPELWNDERPAGEAVLRRFLALAGQSSATPQ